MFIGFFSYKNFKRKQYVNKKLDNNDIQQYIREYNKEKNVVKTIQDLNINKEYDYPVFIIFCFHGSHQSYLSTNEILITDRMVNLNKNYKNIYLYGINYYSTLTFPTEKKIKKNSVQIVQKIINTLDKNKIYHIGFDCWSLGCSVGLYTINEIKFEKNMNLKFIDLRTPALNLFNIAFSNVSILMYLIYPIMFLFQYEDFFNNQKQLLLILKKYKYINLHFYIPCVDKIINIKEQNKLANSINRIYEKNMKLYESGNTHSSKQVLHGFRNNF